MRYHYTQPITHIKKEDVEKLILLAFYEDAPFGDVTSETIFTKNQYAKAILLSKTEGVFCGKEISKIVIELFNKEFEYHIVIQESLQDGSIFKKNQHLMKLYGELPGLLRLERVLLNFVQYLSGISTLTYETVQKAKEINPNIYILDTRKTLPGYRKLAKYAVYCGGGNNHRIHLSEMAMIKDNHIIAQSNIHEAIKKIKDQYPNIKIEVEVDNISQIEEAIINGIDVILLDNMSIETIEEAIEKIFKFCQEKQIQPPLIEISGGWRPEDLYLLKNIKHPIGISMGFLTHSAKFLDICMEIE